MHVFFLGRQARIKVTLRILLPISFISEQTTHLSFHCSAAYTHMTLTLFCYSFFCFGFLLFITKPFQRLCVGGTLGRNKKTQCVCYTPLPYLELQKLNIIRQFTLAYQTAAQLCSVKVKHI